MIWAVAGAAITIMTDTARARTPNSQIPLPIILPASFFQPSPIFRSSKTVSPMVRPVITTVTVFIIMEPVATAETSALVPNCPTTNRSTAAY